MATIRSEAFSHLAMQAWEMWSETQTIVWKKLSCTGAYKDLLQAFGDRHDVVAELVKRMVQDLRSLPTHEYLVREGRIGYQEHDGISFKPWYGFKTMWAHFKEFHDGGKVSSQAFDASIRMPLTCGGYSYAEIPKSYECTMGVTGTLTSLSPEETKVLLFLLLFLLLSSSSSLSVLSPLWNGADAVHPVHSLRLFQGHCHTATPFGSALLTCPIDCLPACVLQ